MTAKPDPPPGQLTIEIGMHSGVVLCSVCGEVDINTADDLRAGVTSAFATGPAVVVDLSELSFFASAGVRVLLETANGLAPGARLAVVSGAATSTVLELCGLSGTFPCVTDRDQAVAECLRIASDADEYQSPTG